MIGSQIKFYAAVAAAIIVAGMCVTIFVQGVMLDSAETKTKVAEQDRDYWKNSAGEQKRRNEELTTSLKVREDELQTLGGKVGKLERRVLALASDDCLDRAIPPELDRLLRDAFPESPGEAGSPGAEAETGPGVER